MSTPAVAFSHRFCVAPMMDYTDRHARYFLRLFSPHIRMYSEMITAQAILKGDRDRLLGFSAQEHPIALQLGGSDPRILADAVDIAQEYGYDEFNLNVGCPSDRVQSARFGACLMAEPGLVADCVAAMKEKTKKPVTVKTRIGIDHLDSYEFLTRLVSRCHEAGSDIFIIHARKAWLQGLSPRENREIPPLDYPRVYQLKRDFPHLTIVINGGIKNLEQCEQHLNFCDGVMLGRALFDNTYILADVENRIFGGSTAVLSREEFVGKFVPYIENELISGTPLPSMTRHLLGLFHGARGGRAWRRFLSEHAHKPGAGVEVLVSALHLISAQV